MSGVGPLDPTLHQEWLLTRNPPDPPLLSRPLRWRCSASVVNMERGVSVSVSPHGVQRTKIDWRLFQVTRFFDGDVLGQLACVQNERVYDITLSGQNAWFEARQVEPHVSTAAYSFEYCTGLRWRFCWHFCPRGPSVLFLHTSLWVDWSGSREVQQ